MFSNHNISQKRLQSPFAPQATQKNPPISNFTRRPSMVALSRRYKLKQQIGKGSYAVVHEAIDEMTGNKVAIKIMDKQNMKTLSGTTSVQLLENEIAIMKRVSSIVDLAPYFVRLFDHMEDAKYVYLVLECLEGGELFDRITKKGKYGEEDARQVMAHLVTGIYRLHQHGIYHRDLKPENCIYSTKDENAELKIIDFGFAKFVEREDIFRGAVGTLSYVSPEVIGQHNYTPGADIWSLGVIMYILLVGYPPFYATSKKDLIRVVTAGEFQFHESYWERISGNAKDLISGMLRKDLNQRLTLEQILSHPWIMHTGSVEHLPSTMARLKVFKAKRKFRGAVMACIWGRSLAFRKRRMSLENIGQHSFNDAEIEAIKLAFRRHCLGRALVTSDQFIAVMKSLGFEHLHLKKMFSMFDVDGNGMVDYKEFVCGLSTLKQGGKEALRMCFNLCDSNGSGNLSKDQIVEVLDHYIQVIRAHTAADIWLHGHILEGLDRLEAEKMSRDPQSGEPRFESKNEGESMQDESSLSSPELVSPDNEAFSFDDLYSVIEKDPSLAHFFRLEGTENIDHEQRFTFGSFISSAASQVESPCASPYSSPCSSPSPLEQYEQKVQSDQNHNQEEYKRPNGVHVHVPRDNSGNSKSQLDPNEAEHSRAFSMASFPSFMSISSATSGSTDQIALLQSNLDLRGESIIGMAKSISAPNLSGLVQAATNLSNSIKSHTASKTSNNSPSPSKSSPLSSKDEQSPTETQKDVDLVFSVRSKSYNVLSQAENRAESQEVKKIPSKPPNHHSILLRELDPEITGGYPNTEDLPESLGSCFDIPEGDNSSSCSDSEDSLTGKRVCENQHELQELKKAKVEGM